MAGSAVLEAGCPDCGQATPESLPLPGPAKLDADARRILQAAAQFAALQGYGEIRSPHLFAALIAEGPWMAGLLREEHIPDQPLLRNILAVVIPKAPHGRPAAVAAGKTVQRALLAAVDHAWADGRCEVAESDLARALLADAEGIVPRSLRKLGLDGLRWACLANQPCAPAG